MRQVTAGFDGEEKVGRNMRSPVRKCLRARQVVEGGINFGRVELLCVEFQIAAAWKCVGVKRPFPAAVDPAGRADEQSGHSVAR